jgi:hypothetical protein
VPDRHRGLVSGFPGTGWVARLPPMQKTSGFGIGIRGRLVGGFLRVSGGPCQAGFLHVRDFDRPDGATWPRLTPERGSP